MRFLANRASLKRVLWWTQRTLCAVGLSALAYCGLVLADAWMFQRLAASKLERPIYSSDNFSGPVSGSRAKRTPTAIAPDGLIGRIQIPRLHLSAIIMEGTDRTTLGRAIGHIRGTGLPGAPGNVGLAGHRDTFFRSLKDARPGDAITFSTPGANYRYLVVSTRIVTPTDVSVLAPDSDEILTLVTCYPFYFVGPAPDRFIVRALRVDSAEDAPGPSP